MLAVLTIGVGVSDVDGNGISTSSVVFICKKASAASTISSFCCLGVLYGIRALGLLRVLTT